MKEMNVSRWKLPWIAKDFIQLMKERDEEIHLFEGMRDHLIELHKRGYTLAIITSNSKENCQNVLGKELCELFSHIDGGSSIFGKAKRITRVLNILDVSKTMPFMSATKPPMAKLHIKQALILLR